jgi:BirA family transcriptional regulator, biotin operon repressor / biotin---[acetyl-CoA-carboxylase] ligase
MTASGSIWPPGWTVRHVAETGSTNADLLDALEDGSASHRHVLVADHQTAGRGRLDRIWEAPPGANLLVSLAFTHVPAVAATLTQRIGLAVVDGVRASAPALAERGATVALKWPNDVLLDGRKLAGILAQRSARTGAVVVGVGLNVGWAPEGAARLGDGVSPSTVLGAVLAAFDALPADCSDRYVAELDTIGRDVQVELPGDVTLRGRATAVDPVGRLVVEEPDGTEHHLDVGDIVHATALHT